MPSGPAVGAAEQGGRLVAGGDIDAVARDEIEAGEGALVAGNAALVLQAALDEVEGDLGQPPLGQRRRSSILMACSRPTVRAA